MIREPWELRDYLRIIRKRIAMITHITLIAALLAGMISVFAMRPVYEANTELLVISSGDRVTNTITGAFRSQTVEELMVIPLADIDANLKIIDTYSSIIKSRLVMELVYQKIGSAIDIPSSLLDRSRELLYSGLYQAEPDPIDLLAELITIRTSEKSQVMTISVQHPSPEQAELIADAVTETFHAEVVKLINIDNIQLISGARANPIPVKPNPMLNVSLAVLVALMLSLTLAFLLEGGKRR